MTRDSVLRRPLAIVSTVLLMAALTVLLALSQGPSAASSLYPSHRARFGYGLDTEWGNIGTYPLSVAQLNAGWYLDYWRSAAPLRPNGIEYVQTIYIHNFGWRSYTTQDGLAGNKVTSILVEANGTKWFGTSGNGVSKYVALPWPGVWTTYTTAQGLAHNDVRAIAIDGTGRKWFGTAGGVSVFDGTTWTTYNVANTGGGLLSNNVRTIAIDLLGRKWIGTDAGMSMFSGTSWTKYTVANTGGGLLSNNIRAIAIDSAGRKWIATDAGVSVLQGTSTWSNYTVANTGGGLASNNVRTVYIDASNRKWFGTDSGVSVLSGTSWTKYTTAQGLAHNDVRAILVDAEGVAWFGTWGGGVSRYDGSEWRSYTAGQGLASSLVHAAALEGKERWFGTWGGVSVYDERTWDQLGAAVVANPGSTWLIGNECDHPQDATPPWVYARRYHDFYTFIKGKDPTAKVASCSIVQATPIRVRWMDDVVREYQAIYGQMMPVDVWNIHEQILREDYYNWGCLVPVVPTIKITISGGTVYTQTANLPLYCKNTAGQLEYCQYDRFGQVAPGQTQVLRPNEYYGYPAYSIADNANAEIFKEHIRRFRQWMKDRGQQDKPLIISEYGVLFPSSWLDPPGDNTVIAFMRNTFRFMLETTDEALGCPSDGYRLVQRWAWFSLNSEPYDPSLNKGYNGSLVYHDHDALTVFGQAYREYTNDAPPQTESVSPEGDTYEPGVTCLFQTTYSDGNGVSDLDEVYLLINAGESQRNGVYLRYDPDANRLYLRNADDTAWLPSGGLTPGSAGTVNNTYAELRAQDCQVSAAGNTLQVTWALRFTSAWRRQPLQIYLKAKDDLGVLEGWNRKGWLVIGDARPQTGEIRPAGGDVDPFVTLVFTSTCSDPDGADDVAQAYLLVNGSPMPEGGVYLRYDRALDRFFLRDLEDTAWLPEGGIAPGATETASHALATLRGRDCHAVQAGDTVTVTWGLAFREPAIGQDYGLYLAVEDIFGVRDGWDAAGSLHVNSNQMYPVEVCQDGDCGAPGTLQYFTGVYKHLDGPEHLRYVDLVLNTREVLTMCVYARYDVSLNKLYLRQPAGKGWLGGGTPGSTGFIKNVFGTLDYRRSSVQSDADTITVTWAITPTWRTSGKLHNLYLHMQDMNGQEEGWGDYGDYIVNRYPNWLIPPPILQTTTVFTAGIRYTIDPRYRDMDGWENLDVMYMAIADTLPTGEMMPGGVFLKYDQRVNRMYLGKADGSGWLPAEGFAPGTKGTIVENEYVKVIGEWSTLGLDGAKIRIVRWRLEFKPAFRGVHKLYLRAIDRFPQCGGDTGWAWKSRFEVR